MTANPPAGVLEEWKIAPSDLTHSEWADVQVTGVKPEAEAATAWRHLRPPEEVRDLRIWPASLQLSVDVTTGTSGSPELSRRNLFQVSRGTFSSNRESFLLSVCLHFGTITYSRVEYLFLPVNILLTLA